MKNVLIASYDMEVGGVERSLAGMLGEFQYDRFHVDLMLYRHKGEFMELLDVRAKLLNEIPAYASFRKSIRQIVFSRQLHLGMARFISKIHARIIGSVKGISEAGYIQQQLMWKYALPFLPKETKTYDIAISYLWPHYFVADKVKAKMKLAWIHTDFSTVDTIQSTDLKMWHKFDYIIAVSDACRQSFLEKYPALSNKTKVIENIMSPEFVRSMASERLDNNPMASDTRFKLLTVARLSHAKGIDNAVKALKLLSDQGYDDIVWYIVGYGGDEVMIQSLIAEYQLEDRFILLGKQINPYPYVQACDLYVQPSRYEGKAVTVTEAKILGKPIVITNYATANSQVVHEFDGVISELSVEGIANGVKRLYRDPELRECLSKNCAEMDYGNDKELDQLYELFESSAERGLAT
ncbi:glycosyl transferase [Paenibacillus sp. FSL H8-0548]|uniref:glycosyltransferase n=1 Tax=Paenibacillus sp. FSL H8-0548 TaxID=1920422 RepID=UPI00096CF647|nr:glycosyltransferase [Paenibacillus sp. FSL H8-0548]OMF35945.1 glycosyl transferase [Paenibacillus sp. FSL H8-0548]